MRIVITALFSALLAALLAVMGWVLLFARFSDVPKQVARPGNWSSLSMDAQDEWLIAHTVTKSGFEALKHILDNFTIFAYPAMALVGVLFLTGLVAIGLNVFLLRNSKTLS